MKKLSTKILAAVAVGVVIGALAIQNKATLYSGQAKGMLGDIKVAADFNGDKIVSVKVLEHSETPSLGGEALKNLSESSIGREVSEIDTVAGATYSSDGFKNAVEDALNNKNM